MASLIAGCFGEGRIGFCSGLVSVSVVINIVLLICSLRGVPLWEGLEMLDLVRALSV
jgi:hypothetical protein